MRQAPCLVIRNARSPEAVTKLTRSAERPRAPPQLSLSMTMKISQRRWLSAVRMAAVTGLTMLITGLAGALFRRAAKRSVQKKQKEQVAREDAEAKARMDGEGGAMQPVAVH